jgi:hypothetical protein
MTVAAGAAHLDDLGERLAALAAARALSGSKVTIIKQLGRTLPDEREPQSVPVPSRTSSG